MEKFLCEFFDNKDNLSIDLSNIKDIHHKYEITNEHFD